MNRNRITSFLGAALLGVLAGLPAGPALADDTEIYVRGVEGVKPNILFVLDTSGSMTALDGTGVSRLDRMKEALFQIIDQTNNVNMGLMRFTDPGGPVLYPVSDIDANAREVESAGGQADVNIAIVDGDDDAEELGGAVKLDSLQLELTRTLGFGDERTVIRQVAASADDAEQGEDLVTPGLTRFMNNTSATLEMVHNFEVFGRRTNGLRFRDLPADTRNAAVLRADLLLYSQRNREGPLSVTFWGHAVDNSQPFPNSATSPCPADPAFGDLLCRRDNASTTAQVQWPEVPDMEGGDLERTPDLGPIVQEIFSRPGWQSPNTNRNLSILFTGTLDSFRDIAAFDDRPARAAILNLEYVPAGAPAGPQHVGLRFRDVRVPQGLRIQRAVIEFTPRRDSAETSQMRVYGEKVASAAPFTTAANDLSRRKTTATSVPWNLTATDAWQQDQPVQTTNIGPVIEEIVGQPGWCGGNDLVLVIEPDSPAGIRPVHSFESDPTRAPVLRIDFEDDPTLGAGEGCSVQSVQRQIGASRDDAKQFSHNNNVNTTSATIEMVDVTGTRQVMAGYRFQSVAVPPGAEVLRAELEWEARDARAAGAASLTVRGEATGDADEFLPARRNLSDRPLTGASVTFSTPAVAANERFATPDLQSVIQQIVNRADWRQDNAMAFIVSGSGQVRVRSFDDSPARSAILRIDYRVNLGDLPPEDGGTVVTVRQRLKEIVSDLTAVGWTPSVDTLYEAALYYRGEPVDYGSTRGSGSLRQRMETRVSHPASYTGGAVLRAPGCTDGNLTSVECLSEQIVGDAVYESPITELCQASYIVFLSDGFANRNSSQTKIRNMIGAASCDSTLPSGESISSGEACGTDLVRFLRTENQTTAVPGRNIVTTYSIGFNFSTPWLEEIGRQGGGAYYTASTAAELAGAFDVILEDVLNRTTSFAAPSLSVNAFNRLFHRNEVYFSLFQPAPSVAWPGNVKKYQLRTTCQGVAGDCQVGEVLDARDPSLPAIGEDERIRDDALSFWSPSPDGAEVRRGGAASQVPAHASRRVYAWTDFDDEPAGEALNDARFALADNGGDGVFDGLAEGTGDERLQLTKELLSWPGDDVSTLDAAAKNELRAELNAHINWIRGQDVDDEDNDGNTTENRFNFADPLHASPIAVTYGGTDAAPVDKIFVATNEGGIRMLNGATGEEEWIFYPRETLPLQRLLRENPIGDKAYGIDGTPALWIHDANQNGVIEPAQGDFVRLFVGMRRGGNSYYALDVTPNAATHPNGLTSPTAIGEIVPRYLWRIDGGSDEHPRMGQTWSRPSLATVLVGGTTAGTAIRKPVLVVGGGYDDSFDGGFQAGGGGAGNAIYLIDPEDGSRLFYASADGPAIHGAGDGVTDPRMIFPFPSDPALMDSNGDGAIDRIYIGDVGGQMWRMDLHPNLSEEPGIEGVVGRLASVSFPVAADPTTAVVQEVDQRSFFYPPDVVQVRSGMGVSDIGRYDLVVAVTGRRPNPLNQIIEDRFFAFRDYNIGFLADDGGGGGVADDGRADGYPTLQGPLANPAVAGPLFDATSINEPEGEDLDVLRAADGYYINLVQSGEKGLAGPIVLAGKVFFTTYLPDGVVDATTCSMAEGRGLLYGLNVLDGSAIFNWDSPEGQPTTVADRRMTLGSGIPSAAVPVFQPEAVTLLIGGGGGATVVDPDIQLPRRRSYWYQQQNQ